MLLSDLLLLTAIVIVVALSGYAGWLFWKLHLQKLAQRQHEKNAAEQRNHKIIESVDVIALAALQGQCDLSEAAIRLYMIMDHLQGEKRVNFAVAYPALFDLFETVKDMPRGEARKKILKKERMKFDFERLKAEARLQHAIYAELEEILHFTGAKPLPERTLSS